MAQQHQKCCSYGVVCASKARPRLAPLPQKMSDRGEWAGCGCSPGQPPTLHIRPVSPRPYIYVYMTHTL